MFLLNLLHSVNPKIVLLSHLIALNSEYHLKFLFDTLNAGPLAMGRENFYNQKQFKCQ